ncbi:MAG: response regulator [Paludibacter sp.]|jgi:PleD family two-component response regulator|nr:response regulator [Bacteroidales bacterium]HOS46597.1 response regulator [Paludibacter sp.]
MIEHNLKNAKILIIDDLESNIDVLRGLLEMEGYTDIKSITDSRKAVETVNTYDPDLILLDLMMPHVDGYEVMEKLKEERLKSLTPGKFLPILVLTADITTQAKHKALRSGAKDFLSKPFDLIEVSYRIKNLLETQYLYQQLKSRNVVLEEKVIEFLKIMDDWYK